MVNLPDIKDKNFINQLKKAIEETGEWPETVRMSFTIPVDVAVSFMYRLERQRLKRVADGSRITKSDVMTQLAWLWSNAEHTIDFKQDIFNQVFPNTVKDVVKTGVRGRPKKL